jgi:hypothetical protein
MIAAGGAPVIFMSESHTNRVAAVGDLLANEADPSVQSALLRAVTRDASGAPLEVDRLIEEFDRQHPLAPTDADYDGPGWLVVQLLTYLAIVHQTDFAARRLAQWTAQPERFVTEVERFAAAARDFLEPSAEHESRERAFRAIAQAADAALERWTRDPAEHLENADISEVDRSELEGALRIAVTITDQIYFASGAYDFDRKDGSPPSGAHARFADLSLPVLATCARTHLAPCVSHVVQALIFLAPLDEKRMLLAIADAVVDSDDYLGDQLAGAEVMPYLTRLLAEQRHLVLYDDEGVTAFRTLLAGFAAAGNEAALELAFTFAEIFR